jgi:hypothetical protein
MQTEGAMGNSIELLESALCHTPEALNAVDVRVAAKVSSNEPRATLVELSAASTAFLSSLSLEIVLNALCSARVTFGLYIAPLP